MIKVTFFHDSNDVIKGFKLNGHAEYGEYGKDIVCSAVSALTVNTVNSIEHFTKDKFSCKNKSGHLEFELKSSASSSDTQLLLHSLKLGLQAIEKDYSTEYISVTSKEV
ncbi:MAG: ribosomal-processing cysteine protease Prp [Lachnospiraceae bacterium]|nr:ribosomal-processing cysteine protease Prp [Lachnospiraceae bacterium]